MNFSRINFLASLIILKIVTFIISFWLSMLVSHKQCCKKVAGEQCLKINEINYYKIYL
jgi:hypothetical protein